jgi:hypothetical protein
LDPISLPSVNLGGASFKKPGFRVAQVTAGFRRYM